MTRSLAAGWHVVLALVAVLGAAPWGVARGQEYPARPVRIVVPFSPGGAVDGPTRIVAQKLGERLGQQVVVENKPGAGATLGAADVAKAPADGYTLLLASQTSAISATLYPKLAFDPVEDFAPVMLIGEEPGVLVVHPSFPAQTLAEFIEYAKANPGRIDYASSGNGSGQHLFAAMFASMGGFRMNHVPYRGSGQATADLLGGTVPVSIPGTAGMMGHIKAGKLRALATTGARRAEALPDLPTIGEAIPGYEAYVWMGLLAPKGTPAAVVERLNRDLRAVMALPDVKAYFTAHNLEVVASSPEAFGKFFRAEKERWARVVKETGAKID
ncbi:MAG TPA: tripartite tricarboxylate transporter substrate binding protein [Casimicrobiaceae bacterium]|nr:tripartite tricarboxylate transporter substrate binding protein [Casimicrobiaceae bacterium]